MCQLFKELPILQQHPCSDSCTTVGASLPPLCCQLDSASPHARQTAPRGVGPDLLSSLRAVSQCSVEPHQARR